MPTNKKDVTLLSHLILFSCYYADERNYCTFSFILIYRANIEHHFPSDYYEKLALFYNLNFTEVYINFEKYATHKLNFYVKSVYLICSGGGGVKFMKYLKRAQAIKVFVNL
jgi:hypothetical protein